MLSSKFSVSSAPAKFTGQAVTAKIFEAEAQNQ